MSSIVIGPSKNIEVGTNFSTSNTNLKYITYENMDVIVQALIPSSSILVKLKPKDNTISAQSKLISASGIIDPNSYFINNLTNTIGFSMTIQAKWKELDTEYNITDSFNVTSKIVIEKNTVSNPTIKLGFVADCICDMPYLDSSLNIVVPILINEINVKISGQANLNLAISD